MKTKSVSRRGFLRTSAVSAASVGAATLVSARLLGKDAPSNTMRIGCIGTGRMGHGDMKACLQSGLETGSSAHIVAPVHRPV